MNVLKLTLERLIRLIYSVLTASFGNIFSISEKGFVCQAFPLFLNQTPQIFSLLLPFNDYNLIRINFCVLSYTKPHLLCNLVAKFSILLPFKRKTHPEPCWWTGWATYITLLLHCWELLYQFKKYSSFKRRENNKNEIYRAGPKWWNRSCFWNWATSTFSCAFSLCLYLQTEKECNDCKLIGTLQVLKFGFILPKIQTW